jgi:hypothetical protein
MQILSWPKLVISPFGFHWEVERARVTKSPVARCLANLASRASSHGVPAPPVTASELSLIDYTAGVFKEATHDGKAANTR